MSFTEHKPLPATRRRQVVATDAAFFWRWARRGLICAGLAIVLMYVGTGCYSQIRMQNLQQKYDQDYKALGQRLRGIWFDQERTAQDAVISSGVKAGISAALFVGLYGGWIWFAWRRFGDRRSASPLHGKSSA